MDNRQTKDLLYEQVARIGKAVSSPKRLELLEILSQKEKTVDTLATEADINIKLASAHLKALKAARLVQSRRDGKYIIYRLSSDDISHLWVTLRTVAEAHLIELSSALAQMFSEPERLTAESRAVLIDRVREGDIVLIDVRPESEYQTRHLPYARSMPLHELERRLAELPSDKEIIAYCRGPFCLWAEEAKRLLALRGYRVSKIADGVPEWLAAGLPVESTIKA